VASPGTASASGHATAPLGLLGGTFDPVHKAHLALARAAMDELGLEGVLWIPSGVPGHRARPRTPVKDRLAMLRLALADEPRFTLDSSDAVSSEPTYTIHTLTRLRGELGSQRALVFIIGADQLLALDSWRDWRHLFELTHFAVAERPGYPVERARLPAALAEELDRREAVRLDGRPAGCILRFAMPPQDVSATAIRAGLAAGKPADALPEAVLDYIHSHHLYMDSGI
jgi:nicotinate-nucleotide adenylyltransferase